jgi:spore germination protein YaaH
MQKQLISAIIILILLFSAGAYALKGTDSHWAGPYAQALFERGIFKGDDSGNANLADNIKRAEFLALLVRAVYPDADIKNGAKSFIDVPYGLWYYDIASFAKQKSIVTGDEQGRLLPENNIKREEIVLMLVRALGLKGGAASFTDVDSSYVYYNEICAAVESGIIKGYPDGSFCPKNPATRGESAAMIARMLGIEFEAPKEDENTANEKINLTWHHITRTGTSDTGEYMEGINVISPTWFRIRSFTEPPAPYEYKLDGDNIYYLQDLGSEQYVKDAHSKGYKVWALFKSNDFSPRNNSGFLNDEAARKSAVSLMRQMIDKYNLDGINMDFENMLVEDKDIYTRFVQEMSEMMKDTGAVLSVDVTKYSPLGGTWSLCYDRARLAQHADYIALMAYDQHNASSSKAGSVADLKWTEEAVLKTLEEVPAEKLLLGIPLYTRLWQSGDGKVLNSSAIGMQTAKNKLAEVNVSAVYDEYTGQNYAKWENSGVVFEIWLEDETSLKNRLDLVKKYSLAGVASWSKQFADSNAWAVISNNLK